MARILSQQEVLEIYTETRLMGVSGRVTVEPEVLENLCATIDAMRATLEAIKEGGNTADECPYCHKGRSGCQQCDSGESIKPHGGGE